MPAANQAFRQLIANRSTVANRSILARGANELSLSELSSRIDAATRHSREADANPLLRMMYLRTGRYADARRLIDEMLKSESRR
jgi:hypothetical protein